MPRGKVTSEMLKFVADSGDADVKEQEKTPAAKFTLIEPEVEEDKDEDELVQAVHNEFAETLETNRPNFKFTLLLVTLFVAVNIGLITLLDDNKKTATQPAENDSVPVVTLDKQPTATTAEKPAFSKMDNSVEKPVLAPTATAPQTPAVTLQKPIPAAPAAAAAFAVKPKPAEKQPAADLLNIIGKY